MSNRSIDIELTLEGGKCICSLIANYIIGKTLFQIYHFYLKDKKQLKNRVLLQTTILSYFLLTNKSVWVIIIISNSEGAVGKGQQRLQLF